MFKLKYRIGKYLEDIISVEGIDGILVGPDLSASMGHPGDYNRKDVVDTIKEIEDITKI